LKTNIELEVLLETVAEVPLVGGGRKSVIDWDDLKGKYLKRGYFTIKDVTTDIEASLKNQGLENKVHYSQVLGWIQRLGKKNEIKVIKKVVKSGDYAGTYYKFEK
jgi:hypothetical protein